jgi:hypothetical protein
VWESIKFEGGSEQQNQIDQCVRSKSSSKSFSGQRSATERILIKRKLQSLKAFETTRRVDIGQEFLGGIF